jgi:5-methylcytosine-specific restriction endonuclease McrA
VEEKLLTLTLDAAWQPISIIPADKGFSMVYSGRARAIEDHSQKPCALFYYPSVIVCNNYIRRSPIPLSATRANIYWRDNLQCQYCGIKGHQRRMTLDHVLPKSRGGDKGWLNLVTCCERCNQIKGDRTPSEASMKLLREPRVPRYDVVRAFKIDKTPDSWDKFLGDRNV